MDALISRADKSREYHRQYRATHRDRARFLTNRWRAANRERRNAREALWREANRERIRERHRVWMAANPDRVRDNTARQRARRYPVLVLGKVNRLDVWARDGGICGLCELPADPASWHVDHIVAVARGGTHTMDNVQVAHPSCNQRKGTRPWTP